MDAFQAAFAVLADRMRIACQASLAWKDADPVRRDAWPAHLVQHRGAWCRSVKRDATRRAACCRADHALPDGAAPRRRRCPFGVVERVVPLHRDGELLGWCFVGLWEGGSAASPPQERAREAGAAAELVARLLAGMAQLHPGARPATDPRLVQARELIADDLQAGLRAGHIARRLGLSTSRFVHWFKAAAGRPFAEELRARLMAVAGARLLAGPEPVTAIALDLGYASPATFTAAFTRFHGRPPARWRREMATAGE